MLRHRFLFLVVLVLAMLLSTASAGRHEKPFPPPTCENTCLLKMREYTPTCKDSKHARHPIACAIACECQVSKAVAFCRDQCAYDCKGVWPPAEGDVEGAE